MSRFFPRVPDLPHKQVYHEQSARKKAQEKEKEVRWREWMTELEERIRRRREGQAGQGGGGVPG